MIKIGILPLAPILTVENGRPTGPLGEILYNSYKFPANTSIYVAIKPQENPLDYFSANIDFTVQAALLPHLNENVSNGPATGNDNCFLMSNREKNIQQISSKFLSIFDKITMSAWIAIIATNLLLLMMLLIVVSKNLNKMLNLFLGLFLRQNSIRLEKNSANLIVITCSIFFYLTQLIALCCLKTEFVLVDNEIKIDTFNDVKFFHRQMFAASSGICFNAYKIFGDSSKNIPLLPSQSPTDQERPDNPGFLRPEVVLLIESRKYHREYACYILSSKSTHTKRANELYYFSPRPALTFIRSLFYRKSMDSKLKRILIATMYNQYELGVFPDTESSGLALIRSLLGKNQDPACTENVQSDDNQFQPLTLSYFGEIVFVSAIIVVLACAAFVCENFFK